MDQVWTRLINLQNNLINIYIAPCGVYILHSVSLQVYWRNNSLSFLLLLLLLCTLVRSNFCLLICSYLLKLYFLYNIFIAWVIKSSRLYFLFFYKFYFLQTGTFASSYSEFILSLYLLINLYRVKFIQSKFLKKIVTSNKG